MLVSLHCCLWPWLAMSLVAAEVPTSHLCKESQSVLKLPGQATILGLFDAHSGANCSEISVGGFQQIAAAAWMVSSLNQIPYIPGIKLGLALYDGCSSMLAAKKSLLNTALDSGCDKSYTLGLVTTMELMASLRSLASDLNVPTFATAVPSDVMSIPTATSVLAALNWTTVSSVFAPSTQLLQSFAASSAEKRICVLGHHLLPSAEEVSVLLRKRPPVHAAMGSQPWDGVTVIMGSWQQISDTVQAARKLNVTAVQCVLIPLDTLSDTSLLEHIPADTLVVSPGVAILRQQEETYISFENHSYKYDANILNSDEQLFISYSLFMNAAIPILEIADKFRMGYVRNCATSANSSKPEICAQMPPFYALPSTSPNNLELQKKIMGLLQSNDRVIFSAVSRINSGTELEEIAVYEVTDGEIQELRLVSNIGNPSFVDDFCKVDVSNATPGRSCKHCANYGHYLSRQGEQSQSRGGIFSRLSWRPDAWVAAAASIAVVGIICSLVIATFIVIRMCKGDVLEGNPIFSFLLLLSIVFTYLATVPFSMTVHDAAHQQYASLFCTLRVTGTSLSYAFLFSIMFSRSLMLASCDQDGGFMSHVNGYLQSVLCFFVLAVQLALSIQFWVISSTFLDPNQCNTMYEGYYFQVLLCYDIFLLIILVCTCPFTIRCKRNYREGMFFTVASILCFIIWVSWTTVYLLSPREWKDAAISGGLTATATGILVTVFIPRTYLMVTAIVRDNLASALPSLACTNSTSVLDLNYRAASHQVLYDCVNPVIPHPAGQINPNFYSEQPQTTTTTSAHKPEEHVESEFQSSAAQENPYHSCESPASPNKVTHF